MNNFEKINKSEKLEELVSIDSQKLLSELSEDISKKFGISKKTAERLTNLKTENGLEGLKDEIKKSEIKAEQKDILDKMGEKKLKELFFSISGAKEVIAKASQNKLDILKYEINTEAFTSSKSWIEDRLPKSIVSIAKNPKNIPDNMIGAVIGTGKSFEKTIDFAYKLGKGIIQFPYHIYLIVNGKAKLDKFKRV